MVTHLPFAFSQSRHLLLSCHCTLAPNCDSRLSVFFRLYFFIASHFFTRIFLSMPAMLVKSVTFSAISKIVFSLGSWGTRSKFIAVWAFHSSCEIKSWCVKGKLQELPSQGCQNKMMSSHSLESTKTFRTYWGVLVLCSSYRKATHWQKQTDGLMCPFFFTFVTMFSSKKK